MRTLNKRNKIKIHLTVLFSWVPMIKMDKLHFVKFTFLPCWTYYFLNIKMFVTFDKLNIKTRKGTLRNPNRNVCMKDTKC